TTLFRSILIHCALLLPFFVNFIIKLFLILTVIMVVNMWINLLHFIFVIVNRPIFLWVTCASDLGDVWMFKIAHIFPRNSPFYIIPFRVPAMFLPQNYVRVCVLRLCGKRQLLIANSFSIHPNSVPYQETRIFPFFLTSRFVL